MAKHHEGGKPGQTSLSVKMGTKKFKTDFGVPTGQNPVHKANKWPHVRVATQSTLVK